MKKILMLAFAMIFAMGLAAGSFAETKGKMDLKVGDELYVCNCGETCPCDSMARAAGNCTCGKKMVKAKVTKVDVDKAYFVVGGKERAFKTTGKFACACGPACKCDMISQNPGKCTCGKEMKEVKN